MSKPVDFWESHDCRSLKDILNCALKKQFSCQHKPLLEVKFENVVLDELHYIYIYIYIYIFKKFQ